jgi:hypothetical protein
MPGTNTQIRRDLTRGDTRGISDAGDTMQGNQRKLTTHQKAVLIQVLLAFPEQRATVCYFPSADDAMAYAQDFLTIFKAIRWQVNDAVLAEATPFTGIAIITSAEEELPPSAEALRDALRIYEIEVAISRNATCKIAPGSFVFAVGSQA